MAITPIVLTLRNVKGSAITATENDANLSNLKTACDELESQKEPADITILKDADIGVSVQGYNANTTIAGNAFNGISQLVQTDGTGKLPAIDGSQLTNLASGFADPMTTIGDIIYRNGSNVTARLPIGTTGQVIGTSDGVNLSFITPAGGGDALVANPLSQFAATTSAQLAGVISDETGSGALVFADTPTLIAPLLGTPTSGNLANCTFPTLNQDTTGNAGTVTNGVYTTDIGTTVQAYDADTTKNDVLNTFTVSQRGTLTTDNDGSFDMNITNRFKCTPTGNFTLTFTNIASQGGIVLLVNTGGYTISAAATTKVSSTLLATISAAGTYVLAYESDGTNVYVTSSQALA